MTYKNCFSHAISNPTMCWMQVQLQPSNFLSDQLFQGVMFTKNTTMIPTLQILPLYSHDLYLLIF